MVGFSKTIRLIISFVTPYRVSYNPNRQAYWFGLFPFRSPLLRESSFLSLPPGTKMFQFSGCAFSHTMYSYVDNMTSLMLGFPIRKSLDQRVLTAPQTISSLVTSFFGL